MTGEGGSGGGLPLRPVALALLLATAAAALVFVLANAGGPSTLAERTRDVAASLRCPVCQSLSVADSPSPLARRMRAVIARDLRAGQSPEEIRSRFVRAYGRWILLDPPRRGVDLVAWAMPAVLLAAALGLSTAAILRWTRSSPSPPPQEGLEPADRELLDEALAAAEVDPE